LLLRLKLNHVSCRLYSIKGDKLVNGPRQLRGHRFEIVTVHFANLALCPSALVFSLTVAFLDLLGRFRAASMIEESQNWALKAEPGRMTAALLDLEFKETSIGLSQKCREGWAISIEPDGPRVRHH
jgi:hypothetical protein